MSCLPCRRTVLLPVSPLIVLLAVPCGLTWQEVHEEQLNHAVARDRQRCQAAAPAQVEPLYSNVPAQEVLVRRASV